MESLWTKYRPKTFDDVLGQDTIIRSLKKVVKDARARSFIFSGPSGTGKTTLARILAMSFSVGGGNINHIEVDGASQSGADAARELVTKSLYRAIGGSPVKFIIIDEAHRLSSAAWTVLLKPVEEPPAHVYYAFCTTEIAKIPKAIITRCTRYDLKPVKEDLICDLLVSVCERENLNPTDEILELIAENSNGSPRQALVFLEECHSTKNVSEARELMRTSGQNKEVVDLARWLIAGKGHTWAAAMKFVHDLQGQDAESIRIVLQNYFASALLKTKGDKAAAHLLELIDAFRTPYTQSDKLAPLLYSIGLAMRLDT
jgi:DNA polymerase III subunit gamma/tau